MCIFFPATSSVIFIMIPIFLWYPDHLNTDYLNHWYKQETQNTCKVLPNIIDKNSFYSVSKLLDFSSFSPKLLQQFLRIFARFNFPPPSPITRDLFVRACVTDNQVAPRANSFFLYVVALLIQPRATTMPRKT